MRILNGLFIDFIYPWALINRIFLVFCFINNKRLIIYIDKIDIDRCGEVDKLHNLLISVVFPSSEPSTDNN